MTKLTITLKPQDSGKSFVYNYGSVTIKVVLDKSQKVSDCYSILFYNERLMLLAHADTNDSSVSRHGKNIVLDASLQHIWIPGNYFLLLRNGSGEVQRFNVCLDDKATFHCYEPVLGSRMSDEDMLSGRLLNKKAHWIKLSNLPGAIQLKRWAIERAKQNELNDQLECLQKKRLTLPNNLLVSYSNPSSVGMFITFLMHVGEIDTERKFADCRTFCDTSKNNIYEEMNDFFSDTEHGSDLFSLVEANSKTFTYVYSGLNALSDTGGKIIIKAILNHWRDGKDSVVFHGTSQEIRHLLEQTPSLQERFPRENRLAFEPYSREELIHTFFEEAEHANLSFSAEAVDKFCHLLSEAYEKGLTGHWDKLFVRKYMEQNLVPTFCKNSIKGISRGVDAGNHAEVSCCDIDEDFFLCHHSCYNEALEELQKMVGLKDIKESIRTLSGQMKFFQERRSLGLRTTNDATYHTILAGNPGTGKTTVAKLLGKIYHSLGLLSKGEVVYADRSTIVGRYIGETEENMKQLLNEAQGNVLFIDEAYTLYTQGDEKDFGRHAIECLLDILARKDPNMLIVFAGYEKEMDKLMSMNQGLSGRFPYHFHFPNYSAEELMQIAERMLLADDYELTPEASDLLLQVIREAADSQADRFSNARWVEQFVRNGIIPAIADRVTTSPHVFSRLAYQRIGIDDVRAATERFRSKAFEQKRHRTIGFCA